MLPSNVTNGLADSCATITARLLESFVVSGGAVRCLGDSGQCCHGVWLRRFSVGKAYSAHEFPGFLLVKLAYNRHSGNKNAFFLQIGADGGFDPTGWQSGNVPGRGGAVHAYYLTGECFAAPFRHEYTLASHDTVSGLGFSLVLFEFS